tara:strand:- start:5497 stop:6045 length:549 start_codon:yes stop_codon:yes gene_type:complete
MTIKKDSIFTITLLMINALLIGLVVVNIVLINRYEEISNRHKTIDINNKNHLNALITIHSNLTKNKNDYLEQFSDDYVFDSSTEAILFREILKKINIASSDYLVINDLLPIKKTNDGQIVSTQLQYKLNDITYPRMIQLIDRVNFKNKYDFINELRILKKNDKNRTLDISLSYTSLGYTLED